MALGVSPDGTGKCAAGSQPLIDDLAIGITHLLLVIAIIRLLSRADLDREPQRKAEADRLPPRRRCRAPPRAEGERNRVGVMRLPGLGRGNRHV
jgi:hypothetical protein